MFKSFRNTLYIAITPEQIEITHVESERKLAEPPLLAIEDKAGKSLIVAFGASAKLAAGSPNVRIENGFSHPRTLLADFAIAEQTLRYLIKQAMPKRFFVTSPFVVLHPLTMLEGGLTQIEIRAFAELAKMAGASQVQVWQGPPLTREQLLNRQFPSTGQLS